MSGNLTDEYLGHFLRLKNDYGEKTCVFMQIGSFYEMQGLEEVGMGNVFDVAKLLNIQVTKKNKSIATVDRSNPYMAGFPKPAIVKYLPVLLEAGWTVAVYDQDDTGSKIQRYLKGVYSSSIPMLVEDDDDGLQSRDLISVYVQLRKNKRETYLGYSVARLDMKTNEFNLAEKHWVTKERVGVEELLEALSGCLVKYEPGEVLILHDDGDFTEAELRRLRDVVGKDVLVHVRVMMKEWCDVTFCNEYLRSVYKSIFFGLLTPVQAFDLEMHQSSVANVVAVLEFIRAHDRKYLENVGVPVMNREESYVLLQSNTLEQLNINKGLFNILNKTRTSIGRRGLRKLLCRPYCKIENILERLELSQKLDKAFTSTKQVDGILDGILDIETLHRRMGLGFITPRQFGGLILSYEKILNLNEVMKSTKELTTDTVNVVNGFLRECRDMFVMDGLGSQCFANGKIPQIDEINGKIKECEDGLERIRGELDNKFGSRKDGEQWVKLGYLESEGYFLMMTKLRWAAIKESVHMDGLNVKGNTNVCKITTEESRGISAELVNNVALLDEKFKLHWVMTMNNLYDKHVKSIHEPLKEFVEMIDISLSNVKCKREYGYCCPEIMTEASCAQVIVKEMRHPIIERINQESCYVPNDVELDESCNGMILYALNSCGKSSLLRALGMNVIMAQCGLYVACSEMKLRPFKTIVSQVDMNDNLWKGQSSFVSEMVGLRRILQIADENTLVLSDELTKGTEVVSATSLFSAAVLTLVSKGTKFMFTTHLQGVAKLDEIRVCERLRIFHLSVDFEEDEDGRSIIVFKRKLEPGPSSELYGLEVARSIGLDAGFIEKSFQIRDKLLERSNEVLNNKRSRYNRGKILDKCEVCGYKPFKKTDIPLDTHHIKAQCSADEKGFIAHFHKDAKFNLVSLCKRCHVDVHSGKIEIEGFVDTSSGRILKWEKQ